MVYSRGPTGTWAAAHLAGEVSSLSAITGANRECTGGKVSIFDCNQGDLMSFLPVSAIGGKRGVQLSDVWGYNDPQNGHGIAVVGRGAGPAVGDVRGTGHPIICGQLAKT